MPPDPVERMFTVPPDRFVEERNVLVKELRSEGKRELADEVAQLRKPTLAIWAVNEAARRRAKEAKAFASAAEALADVQARRKRGDIASAVEKLAALSATLVEEAERAAAESAGKPSEAVRVRVQEIVRDAAADPAARDELSRGQLRQDPEPAGFAALGQLGTIAPAKGGGDGGQAASRRAEQRAAEQAERRAALELEVREARREAAAARAAAERAERKVESLEHALERLEKK